MGFHATRKRTSSLRTSLETYVYTIHTNLLRAIHTLSSMLSNYTSSCNVYNVLENLSFRVYISPPLLVLFALSFSFLPSFCRPPLPPPADVSKDQQHPPAHLHIPCPGNTPLLHHSSGGDATRHGFRLHLQRRRRPPQPPPLSPHRRYLSVTGGRRSREVAGVPGPAGDSDWFQRSQSHA